MVRGRRTGIAAALAIVAVAAVAAGCGGGGSTSSGALRLDPVSAAATKTQSAGAARIRFAMALSGAQTMQVRGSGVIDGTSAQLSFRLPSMAAQLGPDLKNATMNEILLEQKGDYDIYMRAPFLTSQLPGNKQWMKVDFTKLSKSAGVDLGKLMSGSQFEPTDMLSMLKSQGAKVQSLGSATIDGVATTKYRATIDLARALQSKGLKSPLLDRIAAKVKTVSANVWIGKDGLVHRIQFAESVPQAGMRMGMAMDLYDYGAHVSIAAPPSSAVFDATQFAQQGLDSTH